MKDYKNFWGSYAALVLGLFSLMGGAANPSLLIGAWYMIIGSLAYMSAKKRKMRLVEDTSQRKTFELIGIAIICFFVLLTNKADIVNDPFPHLVLPAWALIAYFVIFSKTISPKSTKKKTAQ